MRRLSGNRIIVGVTGSIAAYKSALLLRELARAGAEARVTMTPAACRFITPLTLATLSRADVVLDMFPDEGGGSIRHVELGTWADAMIIAPASANTIAKLACGLADNALTALALSLRCPLVVSPAMDADMFSNPATQDNLETLRRRGVVIVPPGEGELASGLSGPGRLPDTDELMDAVELAVMPGARDLAGITVLVTAGPTWEAVDPVRYIGNYSSGKMGFAVAEAAARRGADALLVTGPTALRTPRGVRRVDVKSAAQMYAAVLEAAGDARILVMAAAVADYRPSDPAPSKIRKEQAGSGITLRLERNPDILEHVGLNKRRQIVVGFALETDDAERNARAKMERKGADFIVLNNPNVPGAGFGSDTNVATLLFADGSSEEPGLMSKKELAHLILDRSVHLMSCLAP